MQDRWMTVKEAAEELNVHSQFLYEACAALGLRHTRVGNGRGHIRIRRSWLDVWAESRACAVVNP